MGLFARRIAARALVAMCGFVGMLACTTMSDEPQVEYIQEARDELRRLLSLEDDAAFVKELFMALEARGMKIILALQAFVWVEKCVEKAVPG